jgi:hypothetical protein
MATQIKPTKKNSPAVKVGRNPNNMPAEAYDKNGTSVADGMDGVLYKTDPNSMSAVESTPGGMPARRVSAGNPNRDALKTSGIETRGNGAATKGRMARGPMA